MKNTIALLAAFLLVITMSAGIFAVPTTYMNNSLEVSVTPDNAGDVGEVLPGTELRIALLEGADDLTRSNLSAAGIDLKRRISSGSDAIKRIYLSNTTQNGKRCVEILVEFIDPYVSVNDKDFAFTAYLTEDRSKIDDTEIEVYGTLANPVIEMDAAELLDLSDGSVAKATAYIREVEVYAGANLYIKTKMFEGQKYYAKATDGADSADMRVLASYPEIERVVSLHAVNMNKPSNEFRLDYSTPYYVYGADMRLLGTTGDKLPYSTKYYLSTEKLDLTGGAGTTE